VTIELTLRSCTCRSPVYLIYFIYLFYLRQVTTELSIERRLACRSRLARARMTWDRISKIQGARSHALRTCVYVCMFVCVCVCACVCSHALCMCVYVHVCVRQYAYRVRMSVSDDKTHIHTHTHTWAPEGTRPQTREKGGGVEKRTGCQEVLRRLGDR
jgi:hypothetical protein